jgi:HAD superfamily hydrolase (TIGR01509 family)
MRSGAELFHRDGINTILFDLDGTLRENNPTFNQALISFSLRLGFQSDSENQRRAHRWLHYYWAQSTELMDDVEKYGSYDDSFWINHSRLYLLSYGCRSEQAAELSPDLFLCMRDEYKPEDSLNGDVADLLQTLSDSGFRLGVVSNRREPFDEQLEELGIGSYFEYYLAAGTINTWKPDPAIFQHALNEIGIEPEQALYVGDNYFADVLGSSRAGVQPVLIDPDSLFPEAECPVIESIGELKPVLDK